MEILGVHVPCVAESLSHGRSKEMAASCRRRRGGRGRLFRWHAGARGRAGDLHRTAEVRRCGEAERVAARHSAISRNPARGSRYRVPRGARRRAGFLLRQDHRHGIGGEGIGAVSLAANAPSQPAEWRGQRGKNSRRVRDRSAVGRSLRGRLCAGTGSCQACGSRRPGHRPALRKDRNVGHSVRARRRSLPHFRQSRGRALVEIDHELRGERHLRAGARHIWRDSSQCRRAQTR